MIKRNKKKTIISSIVILLPILFGLIMWNKLPDIIVTHWNASGAADGSSARIFAVFTLPLFCLVMHFVCLLITGADPGNKNQTKKAETLVFCIMPAISLYSSGMVYAYAFGKEFQSGSATAIFMGIMFIVIGNFLPKCRRNSTLGIKVSWAINDEENWNKTHRFGGIVWVIGGVLILLSVFLPLNVMVTALVIVITALAVIPVLYSYLYYKKQQRGEAPTSPVPRTNQQILFGRITAVFVVVLLIFVAVMLFTGNIEYRYDATSFIVSASYWRDLTVKYDDIASIEYTDSVPSGTRTNGLGSFRLLLGSFTNDDFGAYTRYTYTKCPCAVVITLTNGNILVVNGIDEAATKEIYSNLTQKVQN